MHAVASSKVHIPADVGGHFFYVIQMQTLLKCNAYKCLQIFFLLSADKRSSLILNTARIHAAVKLHVHLIGSLSVHRCEPGKNNAALHRPIGL